jgi:hypothetical protein
MSLLIQLRRMVMGVIAVFSELAGLCILADSSIAVPFRPLLVYADEDFVGQPLQNHCIDYQVSSNVNSLNFLTKINLRRLLEVIDESTTGVISVAITASSFNLFNLGMIVLLKLLCIHRRSSLWEQ